MENGRETLDAKEQVCINGDELGLSVMSKEQAATHAQVEEVSGAIDWPFLPSIG